MSALRAVRMGDHAEHGSLSEGRDGAGFGSLHSTLPPAECRVDRFGDSFPW
jgi:hypothetical protein